MKPFLTDIFSQQLIPEPAASTQSVYHALDPSSKRCSPTNANIDPCSGRQPDRAGGDLGRQLGDRRWTAGAARRPSVKNDMAVSEIEIDAAALAPRRYRARRSPVTWVRNGGLSTLLFLLPLLFVFGLFSWYPIVRTVVMSLQHTNLVEAPTWVGLDNFRAVLHDPLFPIAVKNTAYFALLALIFGYPVPLVAAVLMSEVRRRRHVYSVLAYLPVVIPPVVAVLLWKTFYDAGSVGVFNTALGWVHLGPYPWLQSQSWAMPSLVLESTWANRARP
jgi:multiple sugar transport system permease protein